MFFKEDQHKGFTLIELLVVISIIGLLSSVVVTSLSSARAKAKDAKIMQELRQLASLIQLDYANTNNYATNFNQYYWRDDTYWTDGTNSYLLCTDTVIPRPFVKAGSPFEAQAIALCQSIVTTANAPNRSGLYNGVNGTLWDSTKVWSLMAYLPGKNQYFCIGSSGRTSVSGYTSGDLIIPAGTEGARVSGTQTGIGWISDGCYGNP